MTWSHNGQLPQKALRLAALLTCLLLSSRENNRHVEEEEEEEEGYNWITNRNSNNINTSTCFFRYYIIIGRCALSIL
jgi:hypothetical protein